MKYKMLRKAATAGKVSGRKYHWNPGQIIEAPEGEFDHLADHHYEIVNAEKAELAPGGEKTDLPPGSEISATEAALDLAKEHGIDLSGVVGSGAEGRITKADVETLLDHSTSSKR